MSAIFFTREKRKQKRDGMPKATILQGDVLEQLKRLPSNSVHCCVTSPPYWGLRDYGVDGQIGIEQTFSEWLDKMVEIFEEVRRILHPSGTCWVNMGDSYNSSMSRGSYGNQSKNGYSEHGSKKSQFAGLHAKNLVGQPWRLAFAMQSAGWILRSDVVWHKPTAMPSSVTDRPTSAHEYIHLHAKKARYFFDMDAVRNKDKEVSPEKYAAAAASMKALEAERKESGSHWAGGGAHRTMNQSIQHPSGSALRDVWSIVSEPSAEGHFAAFPSQLPRLCILAGTSVKGCCPKCLEPWIPIIESNGVSQHGGKRKRADAPGAEVSPSSVFRTGVINEKRVTGWSANCKCGAGEPIPCTVLDPFLGSGTTAIVALRHQRNAIGIELNPDYVEMAYRRIRDDAPLFNEVDVYGPEAEIPF